jgi:hypothetical protein
MIHGREVEVGGRVDREVGRSIEPEVSFACGDALPRCHGVRPASNSQKTSANALYTRQ